MEDGSLQSHAPSLNEISDHLRMTQTHYADAYGGDVFIALLEEDFQVRKAMISLMSRLDWT